VDNTPVETLPEAAARPQSSVKVYIKAAVEIVETLMIAAVLFFGINFLTARIRVDGDSMEPTLHNDELIIVNKIAYHLVEPKTTDVIVFYYPRNPSEEYIKRVIGTPGDLVEIRDRKVYVNGIELEEPYINAPPNHGGSWTVPEGSLFVLGDNRNNSSDSRTWGTVPMDYVIGKAVLVYWPQENWGIVAHASALT
jgi:signal peptidase I